MTNWTDQIDYDDFQPVRAPDWNKIVRDDQNHLHEFWGFHLSQDFTRLLQPVNGVQTLELDLTGSDTLVTGGAYTLSYKGVSTPQIAWNALPSEIDTYLRVIPGLYHTQGPNQILRANVTISGGPTLNDGYTFTFDGYYMQGVVEELVATNVSLVNGSHSFDGGLDVTTVTPSDDYAEIPLLVSLNGFKSPPALQPVILGDYPGYWALHAQVSFTSASADTTIQIRLNNSIVPTASSHWDTAGFPHSSPQYLVDIFWEGMIQQDDRIGFYFDTASGAVLSNDPSYSFYEGYRIGEVVI